MPGTFPRLRTNAIAQYPASRRVRFQNQVLRFVDGTVQRYRDSRGQLREWEIHLDQLDENEMAAIEQFFATNQGCFGNFSFVDPWNGQTYPNCSFANSDLTIISLAEMKGRTAFMVKENRA